MVAAQAAGPAKPPAIIEDFLWNIHSVLVATPGPLVLDNLKESYQTHFGYKCAIERFLVVGEGGLAATFKRIPHIVSLFQHNGTHCVKATQAADINKQQLIEADSAYRRELLKKNAAAKAMGTSKAKAKAVAGSKSPTTAAPEGAPAATASAVAGASEPATAGEGQEKRPAEDGQAGGDAKKAKTNSDAETLAKMLVQGVVRVVQNRMKANKGPLPLDQLEEEFRALWKVPFNIQQAGETDAITFLKKWPDKIELHFDGTQHIVQLPKKDKSKAVPPAKAAAPMQDEVATAKNNGDAATVAKANATAPSAKSVLPKPTPPGTSTATAMKAAPAVKAPAGTPDANAAPPPAAVAVSGSTATAVKAPPDVPKKASSPVQPPASIEDFLWNVHTVVHALGGRMPLDQLRDTYSKQLGHKCAIEQFLVVGDGGIAATLKRIPHIVTVAQEKEPGRFMLKATLPQTTTKQQLIAADLSYRRKLQQKNEAAKVAQAKQAPAASTGTQNAASTSPGGPPGATAATAVTASTVAHTVASPAASPVAAKAPAVPATTTSAGQVRPATEAAVGEPDAKRPRTEDQDTLARMLVQGVVRVLRNRQRESTGPLPVNDLHDEFKALWKVPFNLQQAGEVDTVTFLQKWPNKVEVIFDGTQHVVQLSKKVAEKAKSMPVISKASSPGADAPVAKKAASQVATVTAVPSKPGTPALPKVAPAAAASPSNAGAATGALPLKTTLSADGMDESTAVVPAGESLQDPQTLPAVREQAVAMLQMMKDMISRQEGFISALDQLATDAPAA